MTPDTPGSSAPENRQHILDRIRQGRTVKELAIDDTGVVIYTDDPETKCHVVMTTIARKWLDPATFERDGLLAALLEWLGDSDLEHVQALRAAVQRATHPNPYLALTLAGSWHTRTALDPDREPITRRYRLCTHLELFQDPAKWIGLVNELTGVQRLVADVECKDVVITKVLFWDEAYPDQTDWPEWFPRSSGLLKDLQEVRAT